jgi:hypothetical protein
MTSSRSHGILAPGPVVEGLAVVVPTYRLDKDRKWPGVRNPPTPGAGRNVDLAHHSNKPENDVVLGIIRLEDDSLPKPPGRREED